MNVKSHGEIKLPESTLPLLEEVLKLAELARKTGKQSDYDNFKQKQNELKLKLIALNNGVEG